MANAQDLAATFDKLIGGNDEESTVSIWLDTGFAPLNMALSGLYDGGMPAGRVVEMFGGESCGKTAIATSVMAEAQKKGGLPMFFDHEHSFQHSHGENLGLDVSPGKFIYKKPDTFEESVDTAIKVAEAVRERGMIPDDAPMVAVFDSLASMVPKSKFDKSSAEYSMHDNTALARATSAALPALAQFAEKNNMLLLILNQMRLKPGVAFGDPRTTPGGESPKFYSSMRVALGRKQIKEVRNGEKVHVGQEIHAEVIKNKIARPYATADWQFRFRDSDGSGYFDVIGSTLDFLLKKDVLNKSGNKIMWTNGKAYARKSLVDKIEKEGLQQELRDLLPA